MKRFVAALLVVSFGTAAAAQAPDTEFFSFGGDEYAGGQNAEITKPAENDAFAAGFNVGVSSPVSGDAHLAGFNVSVDAAVAGDVYGAGFGVTISAPVGDDLTAAGNTITVASGGRVSGNARLAGQTVTLNAPVAGSVLIAAQVATVTSSISGDLQFTGETLTFAGGAKVNGKVTIRAPNEIDVPATVASADRVSFERLEYAQRVTGPAQVALETVQTMSPWMLIVPAIIWNVVLLVIGLIIFAIFPKRSMSLYQRSVAKPWYTLWVGLLSLSVLFGAIPVLGMTLIGIPLIPVEIIVFVLAWIVAQVTGAYVLGGRILAAFKMQAAPIMVQLVGLFIGLVIVWVLSFVPFLNWLVWLAVLVLGLGGLTRTFVEAGGGEPMEVAAA
jgi:hypothetical protein